MVVKKDDLLMLEGLENTQDKFEYLMELFGWRDEVENLVVEEW